MSRTLPIHQGSSRRVIRVESSQRPEGSVDWTILVDGEDHGGGLAASHSDAYRDAANYLRDVEQREAPEGGTQGP